MKILARVLAMADDDVLGMISPMTIEHIKKAKGDPAPLFKAFRVGHEGEAQPNILGIGRTVQRWFQSAIEKLTDKLYLGTKVYHNHMPTNDEKGRSPIGEIVGKAMRHIEGALSSVAVAYIYPQFRDLPLDVASIEADLLVPKDAAAFDVQDVDVLSITGVALGNSQLSKPAFPGATLLAQLQAFAENTHPQGEKKMTLEEIRTAIQEGKFKPSDVFDPKVLSTDPLVVDIVKDETQNLRGYQLRKLREADDKITALEGEKKALSEKLVGHERATVKAKAKEVFDAIVAERPKLKDDPRLVKYVGRALDKGFEAKDEATLKADLNKFVDDQVAEYADLMGDVKPDVKVTPTPDPNRTPTAPAPDPSNLLDPRNNELIPD